MLPQPAPARTFRLWQLFALMTLVAGWIALIQSIRGLGIAVGVSIGPALLCLTVAHFAGWRRPVRPSVFKRLSLLTLLSLLWFSLYVLSIGPVVAIAQSMALDDEKTKVFYEPVIWLHDHTILQRPLEWYAALWGWH